MKKRLYFSDLPIDKSVDMTVLACHVVEKMSRNGRPFCNLSLLDGRSKVEGVVFASASDLIDRMGDDAGLLSVNLIKTSYGNGFSYKIQEFYKYDGRDSIDDYVTHAPLDVHFMYMAILSACDKVSSKVSGNLNLLVSRLYEQFEDSLLYWAAGRSMHHAYRGGLLYHTYRMLSSGMGMLSVYPELDAELLICGIALHDIGKLLEFQTTAVGDVVYTTDGNLFGHLHLGSNLVRDAANCVIGDDGGSVDAFFPKLKQLQHMIVSHHGKQEWGAVMKPATLEAYVLSSLDYMDTKLDQYGRAVADTEFGMCSEPFSMLDGTCVFHPDNGSALFERGVFSADFFRNGGSFVKDGDRSE